MVGGRGVVSVTEDTVLGCGTSLTNKNEYNIIIYKCKHHSIE